MLNPESLMENETHKVLWDFEIKTDHLISARRIDLQIVNQKKKEKKKKREPSKWLTLPYRHTTGWNFKKSIKGGKC